MLLSRIQQDLFDFTGKDPEDFAGLVEFWYQANSNALSAALTAQPGLSLIVNVSEFQTFESLSKRLFLLADTLIIRDTREWNSESSQYQDIPIPVSGYKPGYIDEVIDKLKDLKPSALTLFQKPAMYWTSTHKKLNNGYDAAYVGGAWNLIPPQFVSWIAGKGRTYMETGNVVYAPFIPPLEMELQFLNEGVSLPDYFNAMPFFHQRYEWLSGEQTHALLSLNIPFLDGLDIQDISRVKTEHQDEFRSFSRAMLESVSSVKAALGTEGFVAEARHIQRDLVDAALADVGKTIVKIKRSQALRRAGLLTGLIGLNGAALLGAPDATMVASLGSSGAALVLEKLAQLKDEGELKEKNGYFLWKLQQASGQ
ncbi:hypothetical protein [Rhodoferax sp. BAB1]|uniref:hypothetical protein n=1 Tax=Rhodoferax sp. BAB1 TaxID=2741720 RepID=UPI0015774F6F|nr:hypothetical protein [Rhodoferax sp. BAB1]QKO21359.1 hypothetical protein HTY51_05400 [Rhodoferax sp. BAB1]